MSAYLILLLIILFMVGVFYLGTRKDDVDYWIRNHLNNCKLRIRRK